VPTGKLLLGNTIFYLTGGTATQIQPTKFQVEGVGWTNPKNTTQSVPTLTADVNTVIRACTGTSNDPPQCTKGALSVPSNWYQPNYPVMWCWGGGSNYSSGECNGVRYGGNVLNDIAFGALTQYVAFDCNGLYDCIAMRAYDVQEGSGCWHCQFHGWGDGGTGLEICGGDQGCQNSSFMDLNVVIEESAPGLRSYCQTNSGGAHGRNTIPILVNSGGNPGPKFIKGVTVDANHCTNSGTSGVNPYDSFDYSSDYGSVEDVLVGQGTTVGLRVGHDGAVNNVTIINAQSGPPVTNSGITECGGITSPTAVLLDNGTNKVTNITLLETGAVPGMNHVTNVLINCSPKVKAYTYNSLAQHAIAHLAIGNINTLIDTGNDVATFPSGMQLGLNTISGSTPALDLTTGNVQQVSCPSGGGGSVTPLVSNILPGMELTFIFVQNSGLLAACTVNFPSNMHGASTVSSTASSVTTQKFVVSNSGTDLYAVGSASTCLSSCGAP
jgi:hypothetical protein